jgi:hypothetical protein
VTLTLLFLVDANLLTRIVRPSCPAPAWRANKTGAAFRRSSGNNTSGSAALPHRCFFGGKTESQAAKPALIGWHGGRIKCREHSQTPLPASDADAGTQA